MSASMPRCVECDYPISEGQIDARLSDGRVWCKACCIRARGRHEDDKAAARKGLPT